MPQNRLFSMQVLFKNAVAKEYDLPTISIPQDRLPRSHHDRSSLLPVSMPSHPFSIIVKHLGNTPLNPSHGYACYLYLDGEFIGARMFSETQRNGLRIDGKSTGGGMILALEFKPRGDLGFIQMVIKKRRNVRLDDEIGTDSTFENQRIAAKRLVYSLLTDKLSRSSQGNLRHASTKVRSTQGHD
jgi:hypothetical protein